MVDIFFIQNIIPINFLYNALIKLNLIFLNIVLIFLHFFHEAMVYKYTSNFKLLSLHKLQRRRETYTNTLGRLMDLATRNR
jgi:hypothetical protein